MVSDAEVNAKLRTGDTGAEPERGPDTATEGDTDTDTETDTNSDTDTDTDTDSETGSDPEVPDVLGHTYDFDLNGPDVTWTAPNAGPFLVDSLSTTHVLLMVEEAGTYLDTVAALGWVSESDGTLQQYPCAVAIDFEAREFDESPAFAVGPRDAEWIAGGFTIPVYDLTYAGTFVPDGSEVQDAQITGLIDTRPLDYLIGADSCSLLASLGDTCIDCPDGEPVCLFMDVMAGSAPLVPDLSIDPDIDPTANADCN